MGEGRPLNGRLRRNSLGRSLLSSLIVVLPLAAWTAGLPLASAIGETSAIAMPSAVGVVASTVVGLEPGSIAPLPTGSVAWQTTECPDRVARFEASGLVWKTDPGLERLARTLAEDVWLLSPMPGIGEIRETLSGATVRLARDLACTDPSAFGADWVAGAAWPERRFIVVRAGEAVGAVAPVRRVLRHELAHLALDRATNGRAPRWLNEGYAQLAAGEWGWDEGWTLRVAFLRDRASLDDLALSFPGHREGAAEAYLLSYTAVDLLLELGGEPALEALLAGLANGASFDQTLRSVYGITADQFEERWKRTVSSRYGSLFVLSRAGVFWIAVTVLVLWVGARRRRRDRAKLDRMRREELESGAAGLPFEVIEVIAPPEDESRSARDRGPDSHDEGSGRPAG